MPAEHAELILGASIQIPARLEAFYQFQRDTA